MSSMHYKTFISYFLFALLLLTGEPNIVWAKSANRSIEKVSFLQNVGQIFDGHYRSRNDIDFKIGTGSLSVFISNKGLQYQWYRQRPASALEREHRSKDDTVVTDVYAMQVKLLDADPNVVPTSQEQQDYYENYYLSYCHGKTAHTYNKITYKNIYPNIDWVLYVDAEKGPGFKYDLIVHPGGKVSDIRIEYKGATSLILNDGAIKATTPMGSIIEEQPYAYDLATKKEISSSYKLDGKMLTYAVAESKNGVVIDPKVNWSTLFGQTETRGTCTAADTFGNSYLCGWTTVTVNNYIADPTVPGFGHQPNHGGGFLDAFISKYDIGGTRKWSTYYGGNGNDKPILATTNQAGDLYVVGTTTSTDAIAIGNTEQTTFGGTAGTTNTDVFLCKFTTFGFGVWGTYMGADPFDEPRGIACDNSGVYIGGITGSTTKIFENGFQATPAIGFLAGYSATNGQRNWGSFFNGYVNGVSLDNRGSLYIAGTTFAYTGVGYGNTYMPSWPGIAGGGIGAGYICRFRASTGTKIWGTYYGDTVAIQLLVSDSFGSVYGSGITQCVNGISTPGSHIPQKGNISLVVGVSPSIAGVFVKFDSSGQRVWGSYYDKLISSMVMGPDHKLYLGGPTIDKFTVGGKVISVTNFPGSGMSYGGTYGGIDGGNKLFLGGEIGFKFTPDPSIPTVQTFPFFVTPNAFQTTVVVPPAPHDGMVIVGRQSELHADTNVYIKFPYVDTLLCAGSTMHLVYGVTNLFRPGNVFTVQLSDVTGSFASAVNVGSTAYNDRGEIVCNIPLGTAEGVGYKFRILSSSPRDTFYNYDMPSRISHYHQPRGVAMQPVCAKLSVTMMDTTSTPPAPPDVRYTWISPDAGRPVGQSNPNIFTNLSLADAGDIIVIANNHSCIRRDTFHIDVTVAPDEPLVIGDTSLCIGESLRLTGRSTTPVDSFAWFNADGTFYGYDSVITKSTIILAHAGLYKVTAMLNGCQSNPAYGQIVTVHSLPLPTATSNSPVCAGDTLKLNGSDTTKTVSYSWTGPQGFIHNKKDSAIKNVTMGFSGQYTVKTTTIHGCENTATTPVTIKPLPNDVGPTSNSPVCTGKELLLNAGNQPAGTVFNWTGPNNYTGQQQNSIKSNITLHDAGLYKLQVSLDGCIKEDTTRVVVNESPDKPKLSSNSPLLTGEVLKLSIDNAQQNLNYDWTGPRGFISQGTDPVLNNVIPGMSGVYTATVSNGICTSYDTITVIITDKKEADPSSMLIFPNPNNGVFRIKGKTQLDAVIELVVFASDGKEVYKASVKPVNKQVDETITISGLASGIYRLRLWVDGEPQTISFTINP